jgi:N-acetylmuramic acid 6-phosphate etherase/N-acetylglucosamine-6-phosphate deacetylase
MALDDTQSLADLGTEQVRSELDNLDQLSVADLVDVMCADVRRAPEALVAAESQLVDAVTKIVERLERGGRLIYIGAGTAGRLGMLDAAEAGPTFNVRDGQVVGVLAGGSDAFGVPVENAEDDFAGGAEALRALNIDDRDAVVGISASGRTPYVLGAMEEATAKGSLTVGISCNHDTPLSHAVICPIEVVVGPELIAGSTRLNSGSAQKLVLNVLSTASMVRLGKTYGNLMVDLRPTNEKLRDRAVRIVARITDSSADVARGALEASGWQTKVACAMIIGHLDADAATSQLERFEGRLRPALESLDATRVASTSSSNEWRRLGVRAAFIDGELVTGDVAVSNGTIVAVGLSGPGEGIAVPGFVDAQINGYAGVDLLHAEVDEIVAMGVALHRDGVIAYQPTLITSDLEQIQRAIANITEARRRSTNGARILGVHLEGPYISMLRAGTHPVEHLRTPNAALTEKLLASGEVTMVTVAPELPGAFEFITTCRTRGITVSLGHSAASAREAEQAFIVGASAVTHLFNAMEPLSARYPGLAGVALAREGVSIQLICDGVHVSDEMLTVAFKAAHGRCVVVSDSIAAAAWDKEFVQLGDVTVHVDNGQARRSDGTLAGSIGQLRHSATRLVQIGIPVVDALRATITLPAQLVGANDSVRFGPGAPAHGIILSERLDVTKRLVAGELISNSK